MHRVPPWYQNAKFGIMIHWGLPSIPAFAPVDDGGPVEILKDHGWQYYFQNTPQAAWYQNSLRLTGSAARQYHIKRFNRTFTYERLAHRFKAEMEGFDPNEWATLFGEVGARYVVMVAKHHDGFPLWPSKTAPREEDYVVSRDVVGDLAHAVRAREMHYGIYYSGLLDWTWQKDPIRDFPDLLLVETTDDYDDYVQAHYTELIDRYRPDILWNDIGLPSGVSRRKIFSHFRSIVPDGVVNDRWRQTSPPLRRLLSGRRARRRVAEAARRAVARGRSAGGKGDFATVEYSTRIQHRTTPWEAVRSVGNSFCYNQQEPKSNFLSGQELIHLLIDVVSKNGNLLLKVGPTPNGRIPDEQRDPLLDLGSWLRANGEAIYGTRPWYRAEGSTNGNIAVRFTARDNALYAILLGRPAGLSVTLHDIDLRRVPRRSDDSGEREFVVRVLGIEQPVGWRRSDNNVVVDLPGSLLESTAVVICLEWAVIQVEPRGSDFYTDVI